MPQVDLFDEIYFEAPPAAVAAAVHDPALWRELWPDLHVTVLQDRGVEGLRFSVDGALVGSSELWLEPVLAGVVVHVFLRADLTRRGSDVAVRPVRPRRALREQRRRTFAARRVLCVLKDRLEAGRPVGVPSIEPRRLPGQEPPGRPVVRVTPDAAT